MTVRPSFNHISPQDTIGSSWKQGSDVTGRNYFYNYVTGETRWEPPETWKAPVKDTWLRQVRALCWLIGYILNYENIL